MICSCDITVPAVLQSFDKVAGLKASNFIKKIPT